MRLDQPIPQRTLRGATVALVALVLCWPAFWNRMPLMFPDSVSYLGYSRPIWHKLLGQALPAEAYATNRSAIFSLWLLGLGWRRLAPIVLVQGLLAAWVLWLAVRSMVPRRPLRLYLALVLSLAVCTGLPWYVSYIMADIYGPLVYLAAFLLVFAGERLAAAEKAGLSAIFVLGVAAHSSHFLIAVGLLAMMTGAWRLGCRAVAGRGLLWVAALLLVAVSCQMALSERLWGRPSLFGKPYPFLMARLLSDGTGRLYLQQHCPVDGWLICRYAANLPRNEDEFVWSEGSIWRTASPADQDELRREQFPLAVRTLAAHPAQQIAHSLHNVAVQLFSCGPVDFWNYPSLRNGGLEWPAPGLTRAYLRSRQVTSSMPTRPVQRIQAPLLVLSAAADLLLLGWALRTRRGLLAGLLLTVLFAVVANAFLSGISTTFGTRLQDRVDWMLAFAAAIGGSLWIARRPAERLQDGA
jgi:hypothetical protein